jgi:hypothetical protein
VAADVVGAGGEHTLLLSMIAQTDGLRLALYNNGAHCTAKGREHHKFTGAKRSCVPCALRERCLRTPERTEVRQVALLVKRAQDRQSAIEQMKTAIDSAHGRRL